jgi:FkbM family methyltransferase
MNIQTILWKTANRVLHPFGYELRSRKAEGTQFTMEATLARATARGTRPGTIVDIGAAAGRWTQKCLRHFPDARYLLIEPLEERRAELEKLCARFPNVEFATAAAGEKPGEAVLSVASDLDGSGIYDNTSGANTRTVPVVSLDTELQKRALPGPYFLKFDTHGFELPILAGATATLRQTTMLLLEAYNFQLTANCLRFHELCTHMETLGFRCADLADPMLRPRDNLFWQVDLVFLPKDAPAFIANTYV